MSAPAFTAALVAVAIAVGTYLFLQHQHRKFKRLPLPPGPRKLPLLGNVFQLPSEFEWETFERWAKEYETQILHVNAAGISIVILDTIDAARDLLERRSSVYSSRPDFMFINKMMGLNWITPFMPTGSKWKGHRRLFQQHFRSSHHIAHDGLENYSKSLVSQLRESPEGYLDHTLHAVGGLLFSLAYGITTKPAKDSLIEYANRIADFVIQAASPVSLIFDSAPLLIPLLTRVFSVSVFKKSKSYWDNVCIQFCDKPFETAKKGMATGNNTSFVCRALESLAKKPMEHSVEEEAIKEVAANIFLAGSSTITGIINNMYYALVRFPDVQKRVHEELDRVVGHDRFPSLEDQANMPFTSATILEIMRWRVNSPLGVAHRTEKEDEYMGYRIPNGSIVFANIWSILHNGNDYPDPHRFNPDRFLREDGQIDQSIADSVDIVFGFGRRICPGMQIAKPTLWMMITSILSVFELGLAKDVNGQTSVLEQEYPSNFMVLQPAPFTCTFQPRHENAENLIRNFAGDR